MPIQALPEATTRTLVSSLVLNDAKSVVKELVDNALDARATAVSIEISANTLDVIQVKDNGTGIGVEDRQLLCRRGCTSKIRSLEDLSRLGGTFLGFRGEALASIAELSQGLTVTTRVDGEIVGTSLKYGASGMLSSSSASHPVGTTVRIQNFLHNIPVRKQTALKSTGKTLQAIKALLFEFAFARPDVRFSLKVLKGKNEKMNWTYAPNSNDSLGEVAAKIVGKDIAAHCTSWSMSSADLEGGALQDGWEIDALLASADADIDKVRNVNQYISIDGRCVNPDRRSMMDIVRTYRKYLQGTLDSSDSTRIARPFLVMRVRCPPESYDVNVEPAKDEVIFFLPEALLSLVEGLFRKAYGDIDDGKNTLNPSEKGSNSIFRTHENMDAVSLDDSDGLETPMQDNTRGKSREVDDTIPEEPARWNPFTLAAMNAVVRPKKMQVPARSSTVNLPSPPLTGPKTGETSDQPRLPVASSHRIPLGSESHLPSPDASGSTRASQNSSPIRNRPTDAPRNVEDDDNDGGPRQTTTVLQAWLTPDSAVRVHLPQPNRTLNLVPPRENISTNPAFEPTGGRERSMSPLKKLQGGLKWGPGQKQFKPPSKVSSSHPHGHPSMPPPPEPERRRRSHSPPSRNTPDEDDTTERNRTRLDAGSERRSLGSSFDQEVEEDNFSTFDAELSEIMDFEYRKKAAIAHQKRLAKAETTTSHKELEPRQRFLTDHGSALSNDDRTTYFTDDETRSRSQAQSHTASSRRLGFNNPHQNRYVAALRDLSQPSHPQQQQRQSNNDTDDDASSTRAEDAPSVEHENETPAPSTSPSIYPRLSEDQNDPRAYLIRQQQRQRTSNSKIYRTKSSNPKLPFESIPTDAATLCLVLHTDAFADLSRIQKQVRVIGSVDRYLTQKIDHGHDDHHHADFELSSSEINDKITPQEWEHVLREMIERKYHPLLKPLQMVQN